MRNVYNRVDWKNQSNRIRRRSDIDGREGRHIILSNSQATKEVRKTKKGAAELLQQDDERRDYGPGPMFSDEQRELLLARAGKSYVEPKGDPYDRRDGESIEMYKTRIRRLLARK